MPKTSKNKFPEAFLVKILTAMSPATVTTFFRKPYLLQPLVILHWTSSASPPIRRFAPALPSSEPTGGARLHVQDTFHLIGRLQPLRQLGPLR